MIVSKNMLIPEVRVVRNMRLVGTLAKVCDGLDVMDSEPTCYVVHSLVKKGKNKWVARVGEVA